MYKFVVFLVCLFAIVPMTFAQDDVETQCLAFYRAAVASTQTECESQPVMSACYGSIPASMVFQNSVEDVEFENPGDVVGLSLVDTLQTEAFDFERGEWGIIRLDVRLNFTDDHIPVYVLGGTHVENTGSVEADVPSYMLTVTSDQGLIVRAEPFPEAEQIGAVFTGNRIRATGRLRDNSWLRVQTEDGQVGWASSVAFPRQDFSMLVPVTLDTPSEFGSMQSFAVTTDPTETDACRFTPPNGVLIQSPEDVDIVRLQVNEIPLNLYPQSTVFIRAEEGEILQVNVIEGQVDMTTAAPLLVEAGNGVTFREGEAPIPRPYDYASLAQLPLELLAREVFVALDFRTLVKPGRPGQDPLEGLGMEDDCTIAAVLAAANLRETPDPAGRVRHVMQIGESANPDGRAPGVDEVLWWRLAPDVWVSSNAVAALGDCGTLPVLPHR